MSSRPTVRLLDHTTPPHIATLIILVSLSALSMNVFLPSLPNMATYFETDYRVMQLSVSLYLAVNAVLQLFIGPISDRFGRRPVILWCVALFVVASLGCIFAPTIEMFLAFRMAQAVIVVGMVLSRAVVRDMVPQAEAAAMIGYVMMGMSLVPMIGPALGGLLDSGFGWQANFWLLAATGVSLFALIYYDLGETAPNTTSSFADQAAEYPELLRARRFWGYCGTSVFTSGAFFAYLGGAPYVGTEIFGLSPAQLGFYFGAPAIGYLVGNGLSGRYSVAAGTDRMIFLGACLTTFGMLLSLVALHFGHQSAVLFFGFVTFVGLGNGMVLPNATSGMLSVRPHLAGTASGLGGALMIGGGAALSAFAGAVLSPGSGALALTLIMFVSGSLAIASILYVIKRQGSVAP